MEDNSNPVRFHESAEDEAIHYHAIEPMAVVCAILGLLSLFAIIDIAGFFFAASGIVLGLLSLMRIKSRPEIFMGRKAALFGVGLSLLCLSAGLTRHMTSNYLTRCQASVVGQKFLQLVADGHPEFAYQWTQRPANRCHLASDIWSHYKSVKEREKELRDFVDEKDIRALLALGKEATIYPLGRSVYLTNNNGEFVRQFYAVDYKEDGKLKTFFFRLFLKQSKMRNGEPQWTVVTHNGGVDPWQKKEARKG